MNEDWMSTCTRKLSHYTGVAEQELKGFVSGRQQWRPARLWGEYDGRFPVSETYVLFSVLDIIEEIFDALDVFPAYIPSIDQAG